jgi:hypothetical protein
MLIRTGESGQFASAHYRDQFPIWFAGREALAPFRDAAEEKVRAHPLTLTPMQVSFDQRLDHADQ